MIFHDSGLKDKIAIVTGGSRGIGREIVRLLAEEGADVTFVYHHSRDAAEQFQNESRDKGWKVTAVLADVRRREACQAAADGVRDRAGRIDLLVNNSGVIRDNLLAGLAPEELSDVIETNVTGMFNATQAVVPAMMSKRSGKIINISSVSGEKGGRGQTNYAASKGAVNAFTKALAVELAPRNIRVNAVAPGVIETDMSKAVREMAGEEALQRILLKRYGTATEVAHAVLFLASKYADYITGEILHVDGGFKMA